jgi:two-component system response regulator YesN
MYKVMIVDDEKQIVDGLCKMIKWSELGFCVCATARNGLEAIPLIKTHKPDLVMTDVRMPIMDGLKMLQHVRENISEDMEFIILSGFSEFQYAQKALQYNVKSYILKPIEEAELYGLLVDIKSLLDSKEIRKSLEIKSCISDYIYGEESTEYKMNLKNEEVLGLRYIAVERHNEIGSLLSYSDTAEEDSGDLSKSIAEKIGELNRRFVLRHTKNKCHMVVGHSLLSSFEYDVKHLALSVNEFLWICKSLKVDILIGKKVSEFKNLHESVESIALCRNKLFYQKRRSIILYDDIKNDKFTNLFDDEGAVIKIITAFRKNESDKFISLVERLMQSMVRIQVVPEIVLLHFDTIMASIMQILSERNEDISDVLEYYSIYKKVQNKTNIFELGRLLIEFCNYCIDFSFTHLKSDSIDIVTKTERYVNENYSEPLKIVDIAEHFFVNPAYLGQQFAKKRGCSLNHYINKVRIDKAKELLESTNHKIYEIAHEVGYDDSNYFSSKFVEYTGQTPSDYRNSKLQNHKILPRTDKQTYKN